MRLYFDLDLGRFVDAPGYSSPVRRADFKRGDAAEIILNFCRGGVRENLSETPQISFMLKEVDEFDAEPVVSSSTWTTSGYDYTCAPSFNTTEVNDLLNSGDGDSDNDVAYVDTIMEITWSEDGGTTWRSSDTITGRIFNDVVKGDEGVPESGVPSYPTAEAVTKDMADRTAEKPLFWDKFERDDTPVLDPPVMTDPPSGGSYDRLTGDSTRVSPTSARIESQGLVCELNEGSFYLAKDLGEQVYNMGMKFRYLEVDPDVAKSYTQLVFLATETLDSLAHMIHVRVTTNNWWIEVFGSSFPGATAFSEYGTHDLYLTQDPYTQHTMEIVTRGDNLTLLVNGVEIASVSDSSIGDRVRTYAWYETALQENEQAIIDEIWANDPLMLQDRIDHGAGKSNQLDLLARGISQQPIEQRFNHHRSATEGELAGVGFLSLQSTTVEVSTTTGADTALWSSIVRANTLCDAGNCYTIEAWGEFAENSNTKELAFYHAGGIRLGSGDRTTNGGAWHLKVMVWKSDTVNSVFYSKFTDSAGCVIGHDTFTGSNGLLYAMKILGRADTAEADVTLSSAWMSWRKF